MRRFHWPLQRLLDVTNQREKARRAELLDLSRQIARLRQQILLQQASVRSLLAELADMDLPLRLRMHADFQACCRAAQQRVEQLQASLTSLADQRSAKARLLMEARKKRQTLERLRDEARQEHARQQGRIEQRRFDEVAHVAKARQMIAARRADATGP